MSSKTLPIAIITSLVAAAAYIIFNNDTSSNHRDDIALNSDLDTSISHWIKYTSKKGNFEVMFPSGAQYLEDYVVDAGTKDENHYQMYVAEENDGSIFMISIVSLKENGKNKDPQKVLDEVISRLYANKPNNEITKSKATNFEELPAKEISIKQSEFDIETLAFIKDDRVFLLSYIAKPNLANKDKFEYFLSSFNFLPNN